MKKMRLLSAILLSAMLSACASDTWMLHMKDGRSAVAQGKPEMDRATRQMIYTDESGKQQAVSESDIQSMSRIR
ncbi:hypothetical protein BL250_16025 [Erwinia sp. OLTSP20]|uniref:YgdI/YgdR family lipoprotein n=1 Tax=unclassified Erwinia TaxID=2622719 RepID=UPI000C188AB3|nr:MULTISPECIES: YgdI/YgdR family lipoprotein [unclassified Erwinia]PIJ49225.1 hypothetical protein BV501_13520 [Erwinia sp. OAMSP11]PIJ70507.1 hypothetical protein BK416_13160 [Erwinia sp. OLSSP12]PIJ78743.1 hypothetical protein BLD47_16940 [Erwinia sp. OLCASP19]PIJ81234.1 hypothetical protein BLD46_12925 [Erwinia sp. OLMTSP26]PIJ84483.1 hypothetical protein BLD49_12130 [Erwinia sp. OLMDSP33]